METSRGVCQGHATVTGRGREHRLLISVFNNRLCRHKISWQARTENKSVVSTHSRKRILHKRNTFVISKSASVNYPSESRVVMEFTLCGACSLGFDKCSMACCLPSYNCTKQSHCLLFSLFISPPFNVGPALIYSRSSLFSLVQTSQVRSVQVWLLFPDWLLLLSIRPLNCPHASFMTTSRLLDF